MLQNTQFQYHTIMPQQPLHTPIEPNNPFIMCIDCSPAGTLELLFLAILWGACFALLTSRIDLPLDQLFLPPMSSSKPAPPTHPPTQSLTYNTAAGFITRSDLQPALDTLTHRLSTTASQRDIDDLGALHNQLAVQCADMQTQIASLDRRLDTVVLAELRRELSAFDV